MHQFLKRFRFDPSNALRVGIEREFFITDQMGQIVPEALRVIEGLKRWYEPANFWSGDPYLALPRQYGYELSACQLETKTDPVDVAALPDALQRVEDETVVQEHRLGFGRSHVEVGPEHMSLEVYPDPDGRYQELVRTMPPHVLQAACRVIGTHIHVGMPDHATALRVYNRVVPECSQLCHEGDGSNGQRLALYRIVAPRCTPQPYESWEHFHAVAVADGFAEDPRSCWTLMRLSVHGTIEFRMFGTTPSLEKVVAWAQRCHGLCQAALA